METKNEEYRTSFFKPTNQQTRANRNMVLWLLLIWVLAVFGFHIVLKLIEEPVPEPALLTYESVKDEVYQGTAGMETYREYAGVQLQVLSKVFISPDDHSRLREAFNWAVFKIADGEQANRLRSEISRFEKIESETTDILEEDYKQAKADLRAVAVPVLGLDKNDVRTRILPLELTSDYTENFSDDQIATLEAILDKYLIHNESVLTRTKILGFPFHYFYTAVFLLVLFVVLCLIYCLRTDVLNKKYGIDY
ncbi:MAG: sodium/substrate symporter small subunit [Bacteroidota bacterium]